MKTIFKNKYIILGGIIFGILLFSGSINLVKQSRASNSIYSIKDTFTSDELKKYDGSNPYLPIYIALDGNVYDVSSGRKYYETGGPYHYLAGKDSSKELNLIGGDIIKRKYKIIGKLVNN